MPLSSDKPHKFPCNQNAQQDDDLTRDVEAPQDLHPCHLVGSEHRVWRCVSAEMMPDVAIIVKAMRLLEDG